MKKFFIGLIVVGLLLLVVSYAINSFVDWYNKPPLTTSIGPTTTMAQGKTKTFVVIDECDTPCGMEVGLSQFIDTGRKTYEVKFNGRTKYESLSGLPNDPIPPEKFNSGMAQFRSPKGEPSMRIKITELR